MKTPLSWINIYTDISDLQKNNSTTELAHEYSIHTAEIDDIIEHNLEKIVIGKVISCEKHPDSTKLSICRVFLGDDLGEETILTGAPNIVDATYVPVAIVGAKLSEDFVIGERKMAGMISRGMICAEDEIGLTTEFTGGIMILEDFFDKNFLEFKIGSDFFDLSLDFPGIDGQIVQIPFRDTTFEIDNKFITNRPDLFSVVGNAREWATVFDKNFISPYSETPIDLDFSDKNIIVNIESDKCLAYSLVATGALEVNKSPLAIQIMMNRAGLAPKLDLVDITNLILTEYGQPMHCFDADKINGEITVRMAKNGEKFLALNDVEYTLTDKDLIIADEVGPLALAGVIGGKNSAVSENTKVVVWESATFDATSVRLSAQRHSIRTDASTRYEKSLDPTLANKTFSRVFEYLDFMGKNPEILGQFSYIDARFLDEKIIELPLSLVNSKAWVNIELDIIEDILTKLGFEILGTRENHEKIFINNEIVEAEDDLFLEIKVPTWRATKDITIAEDLVEEILRIYGYENIPALPISGDFEIQEKNKEKQLYNQILAFFSSANFYEVYNYSFTNALLQAKSLLNFDENLIKITNAYTVDFTHMRNSLAPRLFENIANNLKYSDNLAFFEIGKIYAKNLIRDSKIAKLLESQKTLPYPEKKIIAWVTTFADIRAIREILEKFFTKNLDISAIVSQGSDLGFLHPGASGIYSFNDKILANFGRIHPEIATNFEIPDNTIYFEIDFEEILQIFSNKNTNFKPISQYQAITRELNFVLDKNTETGKIAKIIEKSHPWISDVVVIDIFEDEAKVGANKKSVTFSFVVQSPENTISDDEIKNIMENIVAKIGELGFNLRS